MKNKGKIIQWESDKLPETKGEPDMKQKLLQCDTGTDQGRAELSRLLGEVLQPEKSTHTIPHGSGERGNCTKCDRNLDWSQWHKECGADDPVDPIALTPEEAAKWNRWVNEHIPLFDRLEALMEIAEAFNNTYSNNLEWWAIEAAEVDRLIYVATCKLNAEGGK